MSRKRLDFGEGNDLVEFPTDLALRHAEDRAVEKDVFPAGQLRMKAGANLQQACDAAAQNRASLELAR